MTQNIALLKLRQLTEAKEKAAGASSRKTISESKRPVRSAKRRLGIKEELEVTDQIYVVTDDEGTVISDIITDKEDAIEVAQELADERGEEVVVESIKRNSPKHRKLSRIIRESKKYSNSKRKYRRVSESCRRTKI